MRAGRNKICTNRKVRARKGAFQEYKQKLPVPDEAAGRQMQGTRSEGKRLGSNGLHVHHERKLGRDALQLRDEG